MGSRTAPTIIGGSLSSGTVAPCFSYDLLKFVTVDTQLMAEPRTQPTRNEAKGKEPTPRFQPLTSEKATGNYDLSASASSGSTCDMGKDASCDIQLRKINTASAARLASDCNDLYNINSRHRQSSCTALLVGESALEPASQTVSSDTQKLLF